MEKAHDLSKNKRTVDVSIEEDITFADMLLSENTLKGLHAAGFKKPSPIQKKALPYGRCGFDLIVQAKSGTGKTCVFTVIAMEMLVPSLKKLQVIILAPTREISVQVANVISSISSCMGKIKVESFIGGLPFEQDKKKLAECQIAVGAPGRMKHLISSDIVDLSTVRLFVLDEADRLMEESFRNDISYIFSKLPLNKQTIAVSATFPDELEKFVAEFMNKPIRVNPSGDTILIGVRQFAFSVEYHPNTLSQMKNKTTALLHILSRIPFKQCLVFSNYQTWAETICNDITKEGWPATFINGSQKQPQRLKAFNCLKQNRCRVLFSTDLTSRGIDVENVNLVVSLDLPYDCATYLHRVGRAGRYGTYGIAVTIVNEGEEADRFRTLLYNVGGPNFHVFKLPEGDRLLNIWEANDDQFEKLSGLFGEYKFGKVKMPRKVSGYKEDQVFDQKKEATNIIHQCRLKSPENRRIDTWESLNNALAGIKLDESNTPPREDVKRGITPVPPSVISGILYLENDGWNTFYDEFHAAKKEMNAGKPTEIGQKPSSETKQLQISNENLEKDLPEPPCEEEGSLDSDGNLASSETSESGESSDDDSAINHEMNPGYNEILQNWLSMWMNQSRVIGNYVQYYNYWKDINDK